MIDLPEIYAIDISGIMHLLSDKNNLAVKLTSGSRRQGFYKFSYSDGVYADYLITEFLVPYSEFDLIYTSISNSVRDIVINNEKRPMIIASFVKFGMNDPRFAGNLSKEGIYCGVDINNGTLFGPCMYDNDLDLVETIIHPDSGV